jgi:hypothetical protein
LLAFALCFFTLLLGPGCSSGTGATEDPIAGSDPIAGNDDPVADDPTSGTEPEPTDASGPVQIAITDSSPWHTHPPGAPFTIEVVATGSGIAGSSIQAQWVDSKGQATAAPVTIPDGERVSLSSPGDAVGYYGLVFSSGGSEVEFPPQPAGFPSMEYGFAIMPPADAARTHDPESYFGFIHCYKEVDGQWDAYLRGHHAKTMTWVSSSTTWWNYELERRANNGLSELPLVSGDAWDTSNDAPITEAELDAIAARIGGLAVVSPDGVDWELGREENRHGRYDTDYYFANLTAKVRRVRATLEELTVRGRLVYNFEGFDYDNLERLLASDAIREFDVLSLHPYRWTEFPSPESWFPAYMATVRAMLSEHGLSDMEIWITETGIPVRGTTDPNGFFGYPESGSEVPGASRDYAARYLVKLHALAIAEGVRRVYQYNYQNRGNDPAQAEHHFGLRSYVEEKRVPGFPLPGYVACMTMLDELYRKRFVDVREPHADARVVEFADSDGTGVTLVAWALPGRNVPLSWSALRAGLGAGGVSSLKDTYGTVRSIDASGVTLDDGPVWIEIRDP